MFLNITFSAYVYPLLMLLIGAGSLVVNLWLVSKSNRKFKQDQMNKKADITYVDDKVDTLDKEVCLKLKTYSDSTEETRALIENMSKQINWIYQKHYKA